MAIDAIGKSKIFGNLNKMAADKEIINKNKFNLVFFCKNFRMKTPLSTMLNDEKVSAPNTFVINGLNTSNSILVARAVLLLSFLVAIIRGMQKRIM